MRKSLVPQTQVDYVFWWVFSNYCLAYMIFVYDVCMHEEKFGTDVLFKKPIQINYLNLILMLCSYQNHFLVPQNTVP